MSKLFSISLRSALYALPVSASASSFDIILSQSALPTASEITGASAVQAMISSDTVSSLSRQMLPSRPAADAIKFSASSASLYCAIIVSRLLCRLSRSSIEYSRPPYLKSGCCAYSPISDIATIYRERISSKCASVLPSTLLRVSLSIVILPFSGRHCS